MCQFISTPKLVDNLVLDTHSCLYITFLCVRIQRLHGPPYSPVPAVPLTTEKAAEVATWISERKARYPTRASIATKEAEMAAAVARGELSAVHGRGRGRKELRGGRGGSRASAMSRPRAVHHVV